jgi:tRNA pseudouridine38-40 synthase
MPRYKFLVEYDGSNFAGWQMQDNAPTVQGVLEAAFQQMNGVHCRVFGAGRTDSGVHAMGQVAHVDLPKYWEPYQLGNSINGILRPNKVSILNVEIVPETFNARFSATQRRYLYRILNRRSPPALDAGRVWHVPVPLNADIMHEAAQVLVGTYDFSTFRATSCQALSPIKTLDILNVSRYGEEIEIEAVSRSFLHNQVRSMVGTIKLVGEGKWKVRDVQKALDAKDRTACGVVAPPQGLYLVSVGYEHKIT